MVIGTSRRVYADGSEQVLPLRHDLLERIGYHNGIDQPSAFWTASLHRAAGRLGLGIIDDAAIVLPDIVDQLAAADVRPVVTLGDRALDVLVGSTFRARDVPLAAERPAGRGGCW